MIVLNTTLTFFLIFALRLLDEFMFMHTRHESWDRFHILVVLPELLVLFQPLDLCLFIFIMEFFHREEDVIIFFIFSEFKIDYLCGRLRFDYSFSFHDLWFNLHSYFLMRVMMATRKDSMAFFCWQSNVRLFISNVSIVHSSRDLWLKTWRIGRRISLCFPAKEAIEHLFRLKLEKFKIIWKLLEILCDSFLLLIFHIDVHQESFLEGCIAVTTFTERVLCIVLILHGLVLAVVLIILQTNVLR